MALQNINIDDRNYDQLLDLLRQHIPVADWTDHHPSDPGIMLLELLAWLGEMTLYRMNTVPDAHKDKFLKLLIDPPEAVTAGLVLQFDLDVNRADDLVIPAGTRFATDFKNGERFVFETVKDAVILAPTKNEIPAGTTTVYARSWKRISDEELGTSDGTADQSFALNHSPVLLDFVYNTPQYNPNPVVYVDGEEWQLQQFLLTETSQDSEAKHFMVDTFDNTVRFGNGSYGAIPPEGAVITCTYQVLQGPEALVDSGEVKHILDDIQGLAAGETLTLSGNLDAEGGKYFVEKEDRLAEGLANFKKTFRLITGEDFEDALLDDFNQLQELTRTNSFNVLDGKSLAELPPSTYKVYRTSALMNRKPDDSGRLEEVLSHVTLMVIPEFEANDTPPYYNSDMLQLDSKLKEKILGFLEKKKLIATHLHLMPAKLKDIEIKIKAVIFKEHNSFEMKETIEQAVYGFLDILAGGVDGKGWPTGKNIYKSSLYRVLEAVEGVDYISSLSIGLPGGVSTGNSITIESYELPVVTKLEVTVERR
jgi:hypothetical protein